MTTFTHYMLPREAALALMDYLQDKPHREVRHLIDALMAAPGANFVPSPPPEAGENASTP